MNRLVVTKNGTFEEEIPTEEIEEMERQRQEQEEEEQRKKEEDDRRRERERQIEAEERAKKEKMEETVIDLMHDNQVLLDTITTLDLNNKALITKLQEGRVI